MHRGAGSPLRPQACPPATLQPCPSPHRRAQVGGLTHGAGTQGPQCSWPRALGPRPHSQPASHPSAQQHPGQWGAVSSSPCLVGWGGGICTRLGSGGAWYLHPPVNVGRHLHLKGEAAQALADATPWLHGDSDRPGFLLASPGRSPCRTACGRAVWCGRLASSDVSPGEPWASSPLAPKLTLKHRGWPKAWVWPVSPPCSQLWPLGPWGAGARPAQQGTPWGGVGAPM